MFRRVPLNESFEFVASPEEWETYSSFRDVTPTDLWIDSMRDGRGRLSDCEPLRAAFLHRVRENLVIGAWTAEGFDPTHGAVLQPIPPQLWSRLEFHPYEDEASGAGFSFVGLQMSRTAVLPVDASGAQIRAVDLHEVLKFVATKEEAADYQRLKPAALSPMIWIVGAPETEYDRHHRFCVRLQQRLWARVLPKLTSGEWTGQGYVKGQMNPARIPRELWSELSCDFVESEVFSGPELDLRFHRVRICFSGAEPPRLPESAEVRLRNVMQVLVARVEDGAGRLKKEDLLEIVREALPKQNIAEHMLEVALDESGTRDDLIFKGRPPKSRKKE